MHRRVLDERAIPVLLAIVNIGLGESDEVTKLMQVFINSAIIGSRPVPIARSQTRTEDVDFHPSVLQPFTDFEQLHGAMRTGVAGKDGLLSTGRYLFSE